MKQLRRAWDLVVIFALVLWVDLGGAMAREEKRVREEAGE